MLRLGLLWLTAWHIVPREDFTLTWWIGPHRASEAWCFEDPLGKLYVRDLPKCLMALDNLERLDLAQWFIEEAGK